MYQVCTEQSQIEYGKSLFLARFSSSEHESKKVTIKRRPSAISASAKLIPESEFWYVLDGDWHAFGKICDIDKSGKVGILCEINFPQAGLNRNIAGVVLRDQIGNYAIGHRGNLGGGVPGRGKTTFWKRYEGERITVGDEGSEAEVALVCALGNPNPERQLDTFLSQVSNVRAAEI
jgi:hypothetical protein